MNEFKRQGDQATEVKLAHHQSVDVQVYEEMLDNPEPIASPGTILLVLDTIAECVALLDLYDRKRHLSSEFFALLHDRIISVSYLDLVDRNELETVEKRLHELTGCYRRGKLVGNFPFGVKKAIEH